jgi:hypothetical protein
LPAQAGGSRLLFVSETKKKLIVAALLICMAVPSWMLWGYCFTTMWVWYMLPLGAPALTLWQAVGLTVTISLLRDYAVRVKTAEQKKAEEDETASELLTRGISTGLTPLGVLLIGWLVGLLGGF